MKRLFFVLFSLIMISSCLDDGSGTIETFTDTVTFTYPTLAFRSDSTYFNNGKTPQGFGYNGMMNFYHKLGSDNTVFHGGFILSCLEMPLSLNTEGLNNTYRCYLKIEKQFSNTYAVYYQNPEKDIYMPEHAIAFPYVKNGSCEPVGCYLTNTVEVADAIKENFQLGDRFTVTAIGYLDGKKTGEVEMVLADYSAKNDSIVSIWTPFELKALGEIEFIDFEVASTNPNVPAYFCIDNLVYNAELIY